MCFGRIPLGGLSPNNRGAVGNKNDTQPENGVGFHASHSACYNSKLKELKTGTSRQSLGVQSVLPKTESLYFSFWENDGSVGHIYSRNICCYLE